jgi:hypothetical protein
MATVTVDVHLGRLICQGLIHHHTFLLKTRSGVAAQRETGAQSDPAASLVDWEVVHTEEITVATVEAIVHVDHCGAGLE